MECGTHVPLWMTPARGESSGRSPCQTQVESPHFLAPDGLVPFPWWDATRLSKAVPGARALHRKKRSRRSESLKVEGREEDGASVVGASVFRDDSEVESRRSGSRRVHAMARRKTGS